MTDLAIYIDGNFAGVDNEAALAIIEKAVAYGVEIWGKKEVMAIQMGATWLEGYMEAAGFCDETKEVLRKSIKNYFFI
jgi:hypothetical protein